MSYDKWFPPRGDAQLTHHVNPFWAVDGGGNCLPGPYLPFAIARPGPDTEVPHSTAGYRSEDPIMYFSQNHVSGTGGGGRYGNIGIMPYAGRSRRYPGSFEKKDEHAALGSYCVTLDPSNVRVRITATHQCAVYDLHYPEGEQSNLRLDLAAVIRAEVGDHQWLAYAVGASIGGSIEIVDEQLVTGRADLRGGWGTRSPYSVYFAMSLSAPMQRCWHINVAGMYTSSFSEGVGLQLDLGFGELKQLGVQIAISYVSVAQARAALTREAGTFATVTQQADDVWNQALSLITVSGENADKQTQLYNALYRLFCMPTDRGIDHENERWHSGKQHFADLYCLWDSVRNANSFFALAMPEFHRDFLNNLLDIAEQTGWLPDAWIASHHGSAQGGCAADVLFAEAAIKGIAGVDYDKALTFIQKNSEQDSPDPARQGRRQRAAYLEHGYIPAGEKSSVSLSIEYATQDYCGGVLAAHLGDKQLAQTYAQRAAGIWQLWDDDLKVFLPKNAQGEIVDTIDPFKPSRRDYWNDPHYYEGTAAEWACCVHHDIYGLIERFGGLPAFEDFLDHLFADNIHLWKEIILHAPCLYHYCGKPEKSSATLAKILDTYYSLERDGLPDNEDMGSHATFIVSTLTGLFPAMARDFYYLTIPHFDELCYRLGTAAHELRMAKRGQGAAIQEIYLNGHKIDRAWLLHSEIAKGGTVEIVLGEESGAWQSPPAA